jgi:hypothetical protein
LSSFAQFRRSVGCTKWHGELLPLDDLGRPNGDRHRLDDALTELDAMHTAHECRAIAQAKLGASKRDKQMAES